MFTVLYYWTFDALIIPDVWHNSQLQEMKFNWPNLPGVIALVGGALSRTVPCGYDYIPKMQNSVIPGSCQQLIITYPYRVRVVSPMVSLQSVSIVDVLNDSWFELALPFNAGAVLEENIGGTRQKVHDLSSKNWTLALPWGALCAWGCTYNFPL